MTLIKTSDIDHLIILFNSWRLIWTQDKIVFSTYDIMSGFFAVLFHGFSTTANFTILGDGLQMIEFSINQVAV